MSKISSSTLLTKEGRKSIERWWSSNKEIFRINTRWTNWVQVLSTRVISDNPRRSNKMTGCNKNLERTFCSTDKMHWSLPSKPELVKNLKRFPREAWVLSLSMKEALPETKTVKSLLLMELLAKAYVALFLLIKKVISYHTSAQSTGVSFCRVIMKSLTRTR